MIPPESPSASPHLLSAAELRTEVERIGWFHTMELAPGVVTPGAENTPRKLARAHLPPRFDGKSVLDIGAWDGAYSFEAERRGAARVVAVDTHAWREPAWGPKGFGTKAGFELARRAIGSSVEDREIELERLAPETVGTFDVVLFLGVLYHLPEPWPILDRVASVCGELLVLETHVDLLGVRRPAAAYYPEDELTDDVGNWWGPNVPLLIAKLRQAGFPRITVAHLDRLPYRLTRAAYRAVRGPRFRAGQGRCVLHARR